MSQRDGTRKRPWNGSTLAKLAWPQQPHYPSGPPWARTVLGSAIHRYLERWAQGERPIPLRTLYHSEVANQHEVRYGKEQDADNIVDLGERILDACNTQLVALFDAHEIIGCEVAFRFPLNGYWYDGSIDLVARCKQTGGLMLLDYKSGGTFHGEQIINEAAPQHHLYALGCAYAVELSDKARYVGDHELEWPGRDQYLPALQEWPAGFTYLHLTTDGVVPWPAITPWSPMLASRLLIEHYTAAAVEARRQEQLTLTGA